MASDDKSRALVYMSQGQPYYQSSVDGEDWSSPIDIPVYLATDLNVDRVVNILDLRMIAIAYGTSEGAEEWNPLADLDGNGVVNILDLSAVALDYGKTY